MQFIDLKKQYQRIQEKIKSRIDNVLEHGAYIMGPEIDLLETKLAQFVGCKHAIAVSSGTDALLLALLALELKPGDEVITTPFSFFATAEVIMLLGAKPVFVDIEKDTYNINANLIESAITDKTKAIMPVSLYGQCADMDKIKQIAHKYELPVIEDAAQSFGAEYKGKLSCNLSTIGCTSFFPSKPLGGYGDSGACFTNNDDVANKLRALRTHGQTKRYYHSSIGINGRMDTLQAAILLEKLEIFSEEIILRQKVATTYHQLLKAIIEAPKIKNDRTSVYAQYTIAVDNRDQLVSQLKAKGIPTAIHYPISMHEQPALHDLGYKKGDFPEAEGASQRVLSLPMHPYLELKDQMRIVGALKEVLCPELEMA